MDRILETAKQRAGDMQDTIAAVDAVRAVSVSTGGIVTATVNGMGTLVDLQITDAITSMNARAVAALTVATVHDAVQRADTERERLMSGLHSSLVADHGAPSP